MTLALVIAFVLLAAVCQAATGFGFALVAVPLLSLVLDVKVAVAVCIVLGPTSGILSIAELWRLVRWRTVVVLVLGSAIGAPLGAAILVRSTSTQLRVGVALIMLVSVGLTLAGLKPPRPRFPSVVSLCVGAISGILRSATSMGGPPVALYLLGLGYKPRAFVATNAAYFLLGSVVSISALATAGQLTREVLTLVALCIPALFVGSWCGRWLRIRTPERTFRLLVLGVLVGAAIAVIAPVAAAQV